MAEIKRSGTYKGRKTRDLTRKQVAQGRRVGKAGRSSIGKKEAKAAMKSIDIRDTTWKKASERTGPRAKGGIVVGKDGKPITGTVTLASGKKATYVRGKRVAAKKAAAKPRSQGGGVTRAQAAAARRGSGSGSKQKPTMTRVPPSMRQEGAGSTKSGGSSKPKTIIGRNQPLTKGEAPGRFQSKSRPAAGTTTKTPKVGDTRKVPFGNTGRYKRQRWDGKKWVTITRFD